MAQTKLVYAIYISEYFSSSNRNVVAGCKFFALYCKLLGTPLKPTINFIDGLLYLLVFSYTFLTGFVWIILTSALFLVPQIIHVFMRSRKYKFNYWHVFGLSATKIAYVVKIRALVF